MRVLYHYEQSVFSRRVRLALAYKGIDVELRDGRAVPAYVDEARKVSPLRTMPIFVDGDQVVGDSNAIVQYLELAYADRPTLWPTGREAVASALEVVTLLDVALNALVELGTRCYGLRSDPEWGAFKTEKLERARIAIDTVAARATKAHFVGDRWTIADIWAYSAAFWIASVPRRVAISPPAAQIHSLGFELPPTLGIWAKQHDARPDVVAIFGQT